MTAPICPETGTPMKRGVAPMTISYKDQSSTFEMPGWYCDECDESIHTGDDMKVSDRMLKRLKAQSKSQRTVQLAAQ
ncbi:MAG: YgiT-type zinc finger protein [Desulfurellaceae bacterium]|nr:YgiT-type zinc finger protein [Desulfurellaceae bacterium]